MENASGRLGREKAARAGEWDTLLHFGNGSVLFSGLGSSVSLTNSLGERGTKQGAL